MGSCELVFILLLTSIVVPPSACDVKCSSAKSKTCSAPCAEMDCEKANRSISTDAHGQHFTITLVSGVEDFQNVSSSEWRSHAGGVPVRLLHHPEDVVFCQENQFFVMVINNAKASHEGDYTLDVQFVGGGSASLKFHNVSLADAARVMTTKKPAEAIAPVPRRRARRMAACKCDYTNLILLMLCLTAFLAFASSTCVHHFLRREAEIVRLMVDEEERAHVMRKQKFWKKTRSGKTKRGKKKECRGKGHWEDESDSQEEKTKLD